MTAPVSNPSSTPPVLIRTEASSRIGTGHLMRCLALAEQLQLRDVPVVFAAQHIPPALLERLQQAGMRYQALRDGTDKAEFSQLIEDLQPMAIIMDGYDFDAGYRAAAHALAPVLVIDDGNVDTMLHADMVLNSSPHARPEDYRDKAPGARLLLGPTYALLRREFLDRAASAAPANFRLLITFGGSDPLQLTGPVITQLLETLPASVQFDVIIGGAVATDLAAELAPHAGARLTLHRDTQQMAALMTQASLAVSAAGSTLWELARMGVPALAVVVADNQAGTLQAPMSDWFDSLDARHREAEAVQEIAHSTRALYDDPDALQQRRDTLQRLAVGSGMGDICEQLLQLAGHRHD